MRFLFVNVNKVKFCDTFKMSKRRKISGFFSPKPSTSNNENPNFDTLDKTAYRNENSTNFSSNEPKND